MRRSRRLVIDSLERRDAPVLAFGFMPTAIVYSDPTAPPEPHPGPYPGENIPTDYPTPVPGGPIGPGINFRPVR